MKPLIPLLALLLISISADARLGDTEEKSSERYGSPVMPRSQKGNRLLSKSKEKNYYYQGWQIRAAYVKGTTCRIRYAKIRAKGQPESAAFITLDEAAAILQAEKGEGTWEEMGGKLRSDLLGQLKGALQGGSFTPSASWTNSNGSTAYLRQDKRTLVLDTPVARAYEEFLKEKGHGHSRAGLPDF